MAWLALEPGYRGPACSLTTGFQTSDYGCDHGPTPCAADAVHAPIGPSIWDPFTIVEDSFVPAPRPGGPGDAYR